MQLNIQPGSSAQLRSETSAQRPPAASGMPPTTKSSPREDREETKKLLSNDSQASENAPGENRKDVEEGYEMDDESMHLLC